MDKKQEKLEELFGVKDMPPIEFITLFEPDKSRAYEYLLPLLFGLIGTIFFISLITLIFLTY